MELFINKSRICGVTSKKTFINVQIDKTDNGYLVYGRIKKLASFDDRFNGIFDNRDAINQFLQIQ